MKEFVMLRQNNKIFEEFIIHGELSPNPDLSIPNYTVEGDWSGGAFLLVAGAIAGPITVRGLDLLSTQADKAIVDALIKANAGIAIEAKGIKLHPAPMTAFDFDALPDTPVVNPDHGTSIVGLIAGPHRLPRRVGDGRGSEAGR